MDTAAEIMLIRSAVFAEVAASCSNAVESSSGKANVEETTFTFAPVATVCRFVVWALVETISRQF